MTLSVSFWCKIWLTFFATNIAATLLWRELRRRIVHPWVRMHGVIHHASQLLAEQRGSLPALPFNLRELAGMMTQFAGAAQEAYAQVCALKHELELSRAMMAQVTLQQQAIIASTNRELIEQYRSIIAYANYLDDHIQSQQSDSQLRYDFDDVCESGFNLKLIAQSLELMRSHAPHAITVPLSGLLEQTILALAPSLERRAMKLSSIGVDEGVQAQADITLLAHALWMMLLGTIRYAANESTLRLRCLPSHDEGTAIISIVISELAPGQLTPEERHAHLIRQLHHVTPHMFAETIRLHANVQLAEYMLERTGSHITVVPITSHACEISIILPLVKN